MSSENPTHGDHLVIKIDDQQFQIRDPIVTGRQVLEVAGKRPPDEYIVYWLGKKNVLQDLGLERSVHLHADAVERFLTFRSDRSYRFEIDGKREDWGAPLITEATLRMLAAVGDEYRIFLERKAEPDRLIERGEFVDLTPPGIERFYTERIYTITVFNEDNGRPIELHAHGRDKLSALFEEMYTKLGVSRKPDDRLRCEEGGGDVFPFAELKLNQYVEAGHCKCLVWLFAGGTGGATCQ
jgi:hypothetical protein